MANSDELAHMRRIHDRLAVLDIQHAFIGGWAAVAWGVVRATRDIDLIADIPATARGGVTRNLEEAGYAPEWRGAGDLSDPIPLLLRLTPKSAGEPGVDIVVAMRGADRAALRRAVDIDLGSWRAPVLRPEDLVAMKLAAGGAIDIEDARGILGVQAGKLDEALLSEACRNRKVLPILKKLRERL